MLNDITTQHSAYKKAVDGWCLADDAVCGEHAVKGQGDKYLPRPNPTDTSVANKKRFEQYLLRAVYYNATGRTVKSLVGLAFNRSPEVVIPKAIEVINDDASGGGISLIQQAQTALIQVLTTGRAGLLADYPTTDGQVTVDAQIKGDIRPTIILYEATDIINWRTAQRAGKTYLSMVVLRECYSQPDGYSDNEQTQYRELLLDDAGLYTVNTWQQNAVQGEWDIVKTVNPSRGDGQPWQVIPFTFIGSENNDWDIDDSPIYDIAAVNVAHFRNSADYEDSVYMAGQPMFWISGLDTEWRDHLEKSGLYVGSRAVLPLPLNGQAGIIQAQPNTLAKEAMDQKQQMMATLGARLVIATPGTRTATEVDSNDAVAHSVLSTCCDNVSEAFRKGMQWCADFANAVGTITFSIGTDFGATPLDAQTLTALFALVQGGKMPESDLWSMMRNSGFIDPAKTDDQIREEISSQQPSLVVNAFSGGNKNPGFDANGNPVPVKLPGNGNSKEQAQARAQAVADANSGPAP